jgi:N-acetylmuramoyl-L-alanine amidase
MTMTRRTQEHIKKLIVHCAATPNGKHFSAEQIDQWHADRGFKRNPADIGGHEPTLRHIGYHYVVYVNGGLRNGRQELEIGAHCQGHNSDSVGICLIGTDKFTPAQFLTLRKFIESFRRRYPGATLHGHREFSAKACPGFDLRAWIEKGMPNGFKGHSCDVAHGDSKP